MWADRRKSGNEWGGRVVEREPVCCGVIADTVDGQLVAAANRREMGLDNDLAKRLRTHLMASQNSPIWVTQPKAKRLVRTDDFRNAQPNLITAIDVEFPHVSGTGNIDVAAKKLLKARWASDQRSGIQCGGESNGC